VGGGDVATPCGGASPASCGGGGGGGWGGGVEEGGGGTGGWGWREAAGGSVSGVTARSSCRRGGRGGGRHRRPVVGPVAAATACGVATGCAGGTVGRHPGGPSTTRAPPVLSLAGFLPASSPPPPPFAAAHLYDDGSGRGARCRCRKPCTRHRLGRQHGCQGYCDDDRGSRAAPCGLGQDPVGHWRGHRTGRCCVCYRAVCAQQQWRSRRLVCLWLGCSTTSATPERAAPADVDTRHASGGVGGTRLGGVTAAAAAKADVAGALCVSFVHLKSFSYSRSPKNPALQLLQKSSKSASAGS